MTEQVYLYHLTSLVVGQCDRYGHATTAISTLAKRYLERGRYLEHGG